MAAPERLLAYCFKSGTGCWLWVKPLSKDGYGKIMIDGVQKSCHVWAHIIWIGPVPKGYEVHHTCEVRHCINPEHLKLQSKTEHRREHSRKCRIGHEIPTGKDRCPECTRDYKREYMREYRGRS